MSDIGPLKSSPAITRHPENPILTHEAVPYHATLVFNAGITKYQGKYVMVFRSDLLLGGEHVPFANAKIGPGAPPVKTEQGWLTTFHAVDIDPDRSKNGWEPAWKKRYSIGIMLLDLEDPHKVVGMSKTPLLAPEVSYETDDGFRNDVLFPGGMILEDDGEVKIYYGAADTVECLATAHVDDLIGLCTEIP